MEGFKSIQKKLADFIKRYYKNQLIRGGILFGVIGVLYLFLVLSIEYFLWLNSSGRWLLFCFFIVVELFLLGYFIVIPLLKLVRISKGLGEEEASAIIGSHFPEVKDKLLNLLQLNNGGQRTDLLIASIDQKARELQPIPFELAVDFKRSWVYLKWAGFPVVIVGLLLVLGKFTFFTDSYRRIIHYDREFIPPAPFYFEILNDSLKVREKEDFVLRIRAQGKVFPENVSVRFQGQDHLLRKVQAGFFEYRFNRVEEEFPFRLKAMGINTPVYTLEVMKLPLILNLDMYFDVPDYTGKSDEVIEGAGSARIPEGTRVNWIFETRETEQLHFDLKDTSIVLKPDKGKVFHDMQLFKGMEYTLSASNNDFSEFEPVSHRIVVVPDQFPKIDVARKADSIDPSINYFFGKFSDDYGVRKLEVVVEDQEQEKEVLRKRIPFGSGNPANFHFVFPGDLSLEPGITYTYYFEVFDNDGVNGSKSSKSRVFVSRILTEEVREEKHLSEQKNALGVFNKALREMKHSSKELEDFSRFHKEGKSLGFDERRNLEQFFERQQRQQKMMQKFAKQIQRNQIYDDSLYKENSYKKELRDRLKENEEELKKNETLMEELKNMAEKISREELGEKLEEISRNNYSRQRSLEQLLELTRRYYVQEKHQRLSRDLKKLAGSQEKVSDGSGTSQMEKQKKINEAFQEFRNKMNDLNNQNQELKSPIELERELTKEESISKELKEAIGSMDKKNSEKAVEHQKKAAKEMREMSAKMKARMAAQSGEELKAGIQGLRQVLENLLKFSFQQESLMESFKKLTRKDPSYAKELRAQNDLRDNFEHIDDSLYALALKNPMINEQITGRLVGIEFDLDKTLERLGTNEMPQGISSQHYVITGINELAYLLSDILINLERQANPQLGEGKGEEEFQLPDIIQGQKELQEKFQREIEKEQENKSEGSKGENEERNGVLFRIYQEQQKLRENFERLMREDGLGNENPEVRNAMENLERQLLEKGLNSTNLEMMRQLEHELFEFEKANMLQGEQNSRKSETGKEVETDPAKDQMLKAKEYFKTSEILNRQILPLREIYKEKVREYFEEND